MAERPGYSSGFSPTRSIHQNVRDSPSNDTVPSITAMNATPLAGNGRHESSPPLSGESRPTVRKNTENASPRSSQGSPKSAIPASVVAA